MRVPAMSMTAAVVMLPSVKKKMPIAAVRNPSTIPGVATRKSR